MRVPVLYLLAAVMLWAHPHCFVDVYPAIDQESITVRWVFDEMSSHMLILDFDRDRNGKLNEEESKTLHDETFQDLKKFDYYTYFYHKDKKLPTAPAESFTAAIDENRFYRDIP